MCCIIDSCRSPAPTLTEAQKNAKMYSAHVRSAVCALFFTILFTIDLALSNDLLSQLVLFAPLTAFCLAKTILEGFYAYKLHHLVR